MADPPWPNSVSDSSRFKALPYPTMTIAEIASIPMRDIMEDNANLFLWSTNQMMPEALDLLKVWRLKFKMVITGVKSYGMGRPPLSATEHIIMASAGQPPRPFHEDQILNWFHWGKKLRHSEKPEAAYSLIESISPGMSRLEMFARKTRSGWDSWGNQCSMFD